MIVEFEATVDDFVDVTRRSEKRANPGMPRRVTGLVVALMTAALALAITDLSLAERSEAFGLSLFVIISLYLLFFVDHSPYYRRSIRRLCSQRFGPTWPVRVRVAITESGITFSQNGIPTETEWSAIQGIEETGDAIYFLTKDKSVMAVRKRGFKSGTEMEEFLELAGHHRKLHRKPHRKRLHQ